MLLVTYYAGIMLDAFSYLLCFQLCQHNQPEPTFITIFGIIVLVPSRRFFIESIHLHILGKYICTYVANACTINFENFYAHMYQNTHVFNICCD